MGQATLTARERRRLAPLAAALARARDPGGPPRLEPVGGPIPRAAPAGLLAGTFNPFTRAHAALAVAGHRAGCRLVVLAMAPVSLAKEGLERAHPVDRLDWAAAWARRHPWAVVAAASHPLLVDMAEALGAATGGEVALLLGADKAAQLAEPHWYDDPAAAMDRLGPGGHPAGRRAGRPPGPRAAAAGGAAAHRRLGARAVRHPGPGGRRPRPPAGRPAPGRRRPEGRADRRVRPRRRLPGKDQGAGGANCLRREREARLPSRGP